MLTMTEFRPAPIEILGGAGHAAAAHLASTISRTAQQRGAVDDLDQPDVIMLNLASGGIGLRGVIDQQRAADHINKHTRTLSELGCRHVLLGCNAAHHHLDAVHPMLDVIDMIAATAGVAQAFNPRRVGVIAADSTKAAGLYDHALQHDDVTYANTTVTHHLIREALAGRRRPNELHALCDTLRTQGCDIIIYGCTELALHGNHADDIVDSVNCAAKAAVDVWEHSREQELVR